MSRACEGRARALERCALLCPDEAGLFTTCALDQSFTITDFFDATVLASIYSIASFYTSIASPLQGRLLNGRITLNW